MIFMITGGLFLITGFICVAAAEKISSFLEKKGLIYKKDNYTKILRFIGVVLFFAGFAAMNQARMALR